MIYPGTDLKYKVTAIGRGFDMNVDDWYAIVKNGFGRVMLIVRKGNALTDRHGAYYFMLPKVQAGSYTVDFYAHKADWNFQDRVQRITTHSNLCTVGGADTARVDAEADGLHVCFERVWTVNIGEHVYLTDENGQPVLDSEGNEIWLDETGSESAGVRLSMTGDQLKQLLEGRNPNGKIDTVPELMDAAGGLDDDTEVSLMTEQDADDMMQRILGED